MADNFFVEMFGVQACACLSCAAMPEIERRFFDRRTTRVGDRVEIMYEHYAYFVRCVNGCVPFPASVREWRATAEQAINDWNKEQGQ